MRKIILTMLLLTIIIAFKTNAQVKYNLSLGPIVGAGHSWDNGGLGTGIERKIKPSLNVGGRLMYSAAPTFGLALDATFRTEGTKLKTATSELKKNLNYIRLDPKLLYFFGEYGQSLRPKIGIGSSFGFLVGGTSKTFGGAQYKSTDRNNLLDFGFSGLLGLNYRLKSTTWLNVDAVYNHGVTDFAKNNTGDALQNRSLFLNAGITFGIRRAGEKGKDKIIDVKRPKEFL